MGIVVIGTVFVDIKGYPESTYIPGGRNAGYVEEVYGGVARNIAEDIANVELQPTFVSLVNTGGTGRDIIAHLERHRINTSFMRAVPDGMGTWLAIFNNGGDVVAAISKRPNLAPIADILEEHGDEIFADADSIAIELDMDKNIVGKTLELAKKYGKPVYSAVSNMSIASRRRDFLRSLDCFVCNQQEAGICFSENYDRLKPAEMLEILKEKIAGAGIRRMVVTMGSRGAVFASSDGECGCCPAKPVQVKDTTGAGDAFFSGVVIGLTYGKSLTEACEIGARLSASVITAESNTCPRFRPGEFGIVPRR